MEESGNRIKDRITAFLRKALAVVLDNKTLLIMAAFIAILGWKQDRVNDFIGLNVVSTS